MNDEFINDIENDIQARKDEYNREFQIKEKKTSVIRPPKSVKIAQTPSVMNPKKRLASVSASRNESRNGSVRKSARKSVKPSMPKKENTNTRKKITKNRQT
jgi:hypothetical protein